ncbi:MAG: serine--tRNA ligase, partial [Actinobacteria bacterium]|nr:serine--tRNA ligase [Actinomycetota bacterium]
MIDIKFLRENPEAVRISQRGRGEDPAIVDQILAADEVRRTAIVEFEGLRAEQNIFSKTMGAAKPEEKAAMLEHGKELSALVKAADTRKSEAEETSAQLTLLLSNLLDPAAPIGGEADFVVLEHVGTPRDFTKD